MSLASLDKDACPERVWMDYVASGRTVFVSSTSDPLMIELVTRSGDKLLTHTWFYRDPGAAAPERGFGGSGIPRDDIEAVKLTLPDGKTTTLPVPRPRYAEPPTIHGN